jgi:hypothetical protein
MADVQNLFTSETSTGVPQTLTFQVWNVPEYWCKRWQEYNKKLKSNKFLLINLLYKVITEAYLHNYIQRFASHKLMNIRCSQKINIEIPVTYLIVFTIGKKHGMH